MMQRTPNDPAWYRGGLYHDDMKLERAGPVVHVVVRRLGRSEPRALQPRAQDGVAGDRERAVGGHRAGRALLLHARHRRHHRRRTEHGRRAARLQRDRLRLLRSLPERREDARLDTLPKVTYFTMGLNKWQTADTWPPAGAAADDVLLCRAQARRTPWPATARWPRPRPTRTSRTRSPTTR